MIFWFKYKLHLLVIKRKLKRVLSKTIRESNFDVFSKTKKIEVFTSIFDKVIRKDINNNLDFTGNEKYKEKIDIILDKSLKKALHKLE